jgi:galactokinase
VSWFVPGRVEVFGKHTDYAGGRSLLIASQQGVTASATDAPDAALPGTVTARSTAAEGDVQLVAGEPSELPAGHWGNYVQATIDRLTLNFGALKPVVIEVDSTLPLASGMSSSSALVVSVALALADHNDAEEGAREKMLLWAQQDPLLLARLNAYLVEMEQAIPSAIEALRNGDVEGFGQAAQVSHENADANLGNQVAETNALQRLARELGAVGSSGFGAGFGGSVWALVRTDEAEAFAANWLRAYLEEFPEHSERASTLLTEPAESAHRV